MGKRISKAVRGSKVSTVGLFGLVAILLMAADSKAGMKVTFSAGVSADAKRLLEGDLRRLADLKVTDETGEAARLLKLEGLSSASLEKWLSKRVRFVIDERHSVKAPTLYKVSDAEYPTAAMHEMQVSGIPMLKNESIRAGAGVNGFYQVASSNTGGDSKLAAGPTPGQPQSKTPEGPTVVMGNVGAALYAQGRANSVLVGFRMDGGPTLSIKSPRVGLLQVGEGLFMRLSSAFERGDVDNFAHSVYRLGTLFHEARHSDGNGKNLGMQHAICPDGHEYAGYGACDATANGAYRMGALLWKATVDGCGAECKTSDKELVTLMYADAMSRLLNPVREARVNNSESLCSKLARIRPDVPFCQGMAVLRRQVIEIDDAPEYAKPAVVVGMTEGL